MKRFLLFLLAVAILPAVSFGQNMKAQVPMTQKQIEKMKTTSATPVRADLPKAQTKILNADKNGGIYYETMPTNYYFAGTLDAHMLRGQCVTAYDATANVLLYVKSLYSADPLGSGTTAKGQIWILRSFDRGITWDSIRYVSDTNTYFWSPSITLANPYKTKNFDSLFVFVSANTYSIEPWGSTGLACVRLFKGEFSAFTSVRSAISATKWDITKTMYGMTGEGENQVVNFLAYGQPGADNSSVRSDQYAAYLVNTIKNGELVNTKSNIWPDAWKVSNFNPPASEVQAGYIYNSNVFGATGDDGTPYVMFSNIELNKDTLGRRPVCSKSTDAGKTWTTIDWCPDGALENSLKTINPEFSYMWDSYFWWSKNGDDLVAQGQDELSYLQRFRTRWDWTEGGVKDSMAFNAIIEIRKQGNLWSAIPVTAFDRKIVNMDNPTVKEFIGHDWWRVAPHATSYTAAQSYLWRTTDDEDTDLDTMITTQREHELQISKTPNGDLVAKWIDFTGQTYNDLYAMNKTTLLNSVIEIDTLAKTDVYMSYRKKGSSTWSSPMRVMGDNVPNFTKTSNFYPKKGTMIPKIVPSLNEIPLFDVVFDTLRVADDPRQLYPIELRELAIDHIGSQLVIVHKVALDSAWTPVVEEPKVELKSTIGEIYPNPTSERIEFSLALSREAFVNVEIFNSIGEKVAMVFNGMVNSQANAIVYNEVKNFAAGVYYCIVTVDGQKTTRKFTVTR